MRCSLFPQAVRLVDISSLFFPRPASVALFAVSFFGRLLRDRSSSSILTRTLSPRIIEFACPSRVKFVRFSPLTPSQNFPFFLFSAAAERHEPILLMWLPYNHYSSCPGISPQRRSPPNQLSQAAFSFCSPLSSTFHVFRNRFVDFSL